MTRVRPNGARVPGSAHGRGRRPTIPAYSYQAHTRWFYGDDFARRISHNILRRYWGMKRVNYVPRAEYFARDQATR